MGLFSSISSFVKKAVAVVQPIAAIAASFTPVGAAAGLATGVLGIRNPLGIGTPGIFPPGAFGPPQPEPAFADIPFADIGPSGCPVPAARPAFRGRGIFGFSTFRPRPAFPQQAVSPGFVRPTFRAFQPIFNPSGRIQNTANGMFQFQRAPGLSPFQSSFAGFGGRFTPFGSFNRRVSPQQRAAVPQASQPTGRALGAALGTKPFIPSPSIRPLPARASFVTPVVKSRLNQPAPPAGRAAAIAVQSQPAEVTGVGGFLGATSFFRRVSLAKRTASKFFGL